MLDDNLTSVTVDSKPCAWYMQSTGWGPGGIFAFRLCRLTAMARETLQGPGRAGKGHCAAECRPKVPLHVMILLLS
jgi:hypothetical protein